MLLLEICLCNCLFPPPRRLSKSDYKCRLSSQFKQLPPLISPPRLLYSFPALIWSDMAAIGAVIGLNQAVSPSLTIPRLCSIGRKQVDIWSKISFPRSNLFAAVVTNVSSTISWCLFVTLIFQFFLKASASSSSNTSDGEERKMVIKKDKDGWKIDFSGEKPATPLLDTINYPIHMKNLSVPVCCVWILTHLRKNIMMKALFSPQLYVAE